MKKSNDSKMVGIKTKVKVVNDKPCIVLKASTRGSYKKVKAETVTLPVESLIYWYPMYFYYDWEYNERDNEIELSVLTSAPKEDLEFIEKPLKLSDCIDLKTGEGKDNKIYRDNLAFMLTANQVFNGKLLTLLDNDFNKERLELNQTLVSQAMLNVRWACYDRCLTYLKDNKDNELNYSNVLSAKPEQRDKVIYSFATDDEKSLLIKLGAVTRMNLLLSKIIGAM